MEWWVKEIVGPVGHMVERPDNKGLEWWVKEIVGPEAGNKSSGVTWG